MKIRCDQNSIRLRLRKSELVQLRAEQWLETAVHFLDCQDFAWELVLRDHAADIQAQFSDGRIQVQVPTDVAQQWMDSNTVSLERFVPLAEGGSLHLLIEKDFPCKDRPDEDPGDFFAELAEEAPMKC